MSPSCIISAWKDFLSPTDEYVTVGTDPCHFAADLLSVIVAIEIVDIARWSVSYVYLWQWIFNNVKTAGRERGMTASLTGRRAENPCCPKNGVHKKQENSVQKEKRLRQYPPYGSNRTERNFSPPDTAPA